MVTPVVAPRQSAGTEATPPRGSESLVALLEARVAATADRPAIIDPLAGSVAWTWGDVAAAAIGVARALESAGLVRGDRVAHLAAHGPDWIVVDLACLLGGFVHVAPHAATPAGEQERLLGWLAPRGTVVGREASVSRGGGIVVDMRPRDGLTLGLGSDGWRPLAADRNALLAELRRRTAACDPDACATILLSSGTTGRPHGVLHSQRGLAANAVAAAEVFLDDPRDVRLSWLPLSHALARTGDLYTALVRGGCLAVVCDRGRILDACRAARPAVILGVPAFFERLETGVRTGRLADLPAALGGSVRVCISGGAPLRGRTAACFTSRGVPLVEGYGLAEAGPVVTLSNPRIARPGTVGPPIPGVEVRIDERPGSHGQLLVRTPSRALGTLGPDDVAPRAAAAEWLETGDLASLDEAGHLRITGRLRDTLVLATGEKLPPADVERALAEDEAVAQVCVVGDGLRHPVAIVVPEPAALRAAVRRLRVVVTSRRRALEHPRVLAWLARRLARRQRQLPRAWRVRRAFLVGRAFDAEAGEVTESLKLRRQVIAAAFAARIAAVAADPPPRWACVVAGSPEREATMTRRPDGQGWLAAATWRSGDGGFMAAAAVTARPNASVVEAVVERSCGEIGALAAAGRLYDPPVRPAGDPAPLDDAPRPPRGRFSRAAEEALGETGLWGLSAPTGFGGSGATLGELAWAITRVAAASPTAAGMLAVHASIGAVAAVTAFGTPEQQARFLPGLAAGRPLSIFGGTEPEVGCDLGAVRAVWERSAPGRLALSGTKMFITNAVHGRLVKVLALLDGRPAVGLVRLPDTDTPHFRLRHYDLHPLKHAHNAALEFHRFEIDETDLLAAGGDRAGRAADGMRIVWHGLNRGRVTLAAQAAGTLRHLLAQARDHALRRSTWGQPIGSRELVRGRLARIASGALACDAMAAWAAAAIDAGGSGELEAIAAKVTASGCVRDGAIDALGIHGGRAFLVGHPLGDSFHDHFAVTVYEGESDLLGLALFKGLCKHHPSASATGWRRAAGWLAWATSRLAAGGRQDRQLLDGRLRDHARRARRGLAGLALRIDAAIRRHGRGLADRQLEVGQLSAAVREFTSMLAVVHHADLCGGDAAADVWCRLADARAEGRQPHPRDLAAVAALGAAIVDGSFTLDDR